MSTGAAPRSRPVLVTTAVVLWQGRGSGRARFWMAVLGALGFLGACVPPYGIATVTGVAGDVAAVLTYLPAARGYFPPRPPRASKTPAPRVVGWDPETGEPIRASD